MVAEVAIDIDAAAGMSRIAMTVLAPETILRKMKKHCKLSCGEQ